MLVAGALDTTRGCRFCLYYFMQHRLSTKESTTLLFFFWSDYYYSKEMLLYRLLCSDRYGKWSVFFKIFEVKSQLGPLLSKYLNTNNKYQNFISKKLLIFMHPNLVGLYITVGCSRYYKMHTRGTLQRKTTNLLWHLFYFCLLRFFFARGEGGTC